MSAADFTKHSILRLNGEPSLAGALWKVENEGRQVRKEMNDDSIFIGWYYA